MIEKRSVDLILDKNFSSFEKKMIPMATYKTNLQLFKLSDRISDLKKYISQKDKKIKISPVFKYRTSLFAVNTLYLVAISCFILFIYLAMAYNKGMYHNSVTMSKNLFSKGYRMQQSLSQLLIIIENQMSDDPVFSTNVTTSMITSSLTKEALSLNLESDIFGYSDVLSKFIKDLVQYNMCRNFFLEEFIQVLEICLKFFPKINYTGGTPISEQTNLDQFYSNPDNIFVFPDPTFNQTKGSFVLSLQTLSTNIKNNFAIIISKIDNKDFVSEKTPKEELQNLFSKIFQLSQNIYYWMDFNHHAIVF